MSNLNPPSQYAVDEIDNTKLNEIKGNIIKMFMNRGFIKPENYKKYVNKFITDENDDVILIEELLDTMEKNNLDYTNTFRDLMNDKINNETLKKFHAKWKIRIDKQNRSQEEFLTLMRNVNPVVIPRNHKVEESLKEAHKGNLVSLNNLLNALKDPYTERSDLALYQQPAPETDKKYKTFCGT